MFCKSDPQHLYTTLLCVINTTPRKKITTKKPKKNQPKNQTKTKGNKQANKKKHKTIQTHKKTALCVEGLFFFVLSNVLFFLVSIGAR